LLRFLEFFPAKFTVSVCGLVPLKKISQETVILD